MPALVTPRYWREVRWSAHRRRRIFAIIPVYAATVAFYLWTASTSGAPNGIGATSSPYNELTDGMLAGHLYLPLSIPRVFLSLKDPWNPALNKGFSNYFHDLAFYHGHLYLAWGLSPVLTLYLPWRILHVGGIPDNWAVAVYGSIGVAAAIATLTYLLDTYVPAARNWKILAGIVTLSLCSVVPYLLRRPASYEVNISASYCFAMLALYLLVSGCLRTTRVRRLALASLCLGLAAGGHVDAVVLGLALPVVGAFVWRRLGAVDGRARVRLVLALGVPFSALLALYGLYNWARFGSPLQYGGYYQLTGVNQQAEKFF